ncbi:MAG: short-chain dehydrogenase [Polynucleobacter sp. 24-46-87]|jgi:NAD(P)-dependent dehydrogenase (short-subunit alcohol dehydrogenase family)|uniref:SDR family NAD(P)-dependent oxidoreductase n=1 Tax=unclassified Polynucleobacter TaxID=2640945 RepID=UPI000BD5CC32|nr:MULTISPECIES: SDR family NAD(P)-dependent oxidoreductase [unclassified Polynucleobacter]OYY21691.1 MAG: short-chain dehydrogenase [Polynucleobacter sp. 35-46-11]OZA16030.1 MAG: short-chain dehydrogenase [Polynucleobacter sp. 24-46-87]OZA76958.1 MAG: short-chain dehydrogenase [Polynucleobacter sp. 39-46-10]
MPLIPIPFRALVIGSSGTIGSAFLELLNSDPACSAAIGIHRNSISPIDYQDLSTIERAAKALAGEAPFQLIINTTGILHSSDWMPEKKLDDLNAEQLQMLMQINAIGPGLTIKYFSKLLDPNQSVMATLSAKVGSIEDNRLGGWYSYRASKAALNMLIKTASIEFSRTKPNTALVALHPGTVNSRLSKPFKGEQIGRPPLDAANDILNVLLSLNKEDSGSFITYSGERLPW